MDKKVSKHTSVSHEILNVFDVVAISLVKGLPSQIIGTRDVVIASSKTDAENKYMEIHSDLIGRAGIDIKKRDVFDLVVTELG